MSATAESLRPGFTLCLLPKSVCEEILGGESSSKAPGKSPVPWLCCPSAACLSFPSVTSVKDPPEGKITGLCGGGQCCPGGARYPQNPCFQQLGWAGGLSSQGKAPAPLKATSASVSCPCLVPPERSHAPRAAAPGLGRFLGRRQAQGPAAGACCSLLPIPAPSRRGREREKAGEKGRVKSIIFKQKPLRPKGPFKSCLFN